MPAERNDSVADLRALKGRRKLTRATANNAGEAAAETATIADDEFERFLERVDRN